MMALVNVLMPSHFCLVSLLGSSLVLQGSAVMNVRGGELVSCSQPGEAAQGFTQSGTCLDYNEADAAARTKSGYASAHMTVCIPKTAYFCEGTYCAGMHDCTGQAGQCPVQNLCVCHFMFAGYINQTGCDAVVEPVCEATSMAALKAYAKESNTSSLFKNALKCLRKKCNLPEALGLYDAEVLEDLQAKESSGYLPLVALALFACVCALTTKLSLSHARSVGVEGVDLVHTVDLADEPCVE